ncbi:MAG TPA: hypothetical protein VF984_12750 [Actinomycetota bacterium]
MPIVLAAIALVACVTGTEEPNVGGTPVGRPGSYTFSGSGVQASLTMIGTAGQLEIENQGATDLGAPGVAAVDAAGNRVNASVANAAPVSAGSSALFQISFPAGFRPGNYPTLRLDFGGQDFGTLQRTA